MKGPTLGPWRWHWRSEDGIANGSVYAMPREGHAYAVAMCPRYQTKEQWEADAALIAAAPEMLAALKAAEKLLDRLGPGYAGLAYFDEPRLAIIRAVNKAESQP